MTEKTFVLPPEIEALIADRSTLWAKYDAARADASALTSLSREYGMRGEVAEIENLTEDGDAPEEIRAALAEVSAVKAELGALDRQRQTNQRQIDEIRAHAQNMYMLWGAIAVVVILFVVWLFFFA